MGFAGRGVGSARGRRGVGAGEVRSWGGGGGVRVDACGQCRESA